VPTTPLSPQAAGRRLTGPAREPTPHERLLEEIVQAGPLRPVPPPSIRTPSLGTMPLTAGGSAAEPDPDSQGDFVVVGANGKSHKKLSVNMNALSDILGGWDPSTQVQLAFATQAAASPRKSPGPGDSDRAAMPVGRAGSPSQRTAEGHEGATELASEPQKKSPVRLVPSAASEPPPSPPSFMNFEELKHIRCTLAIVEMEDLLDDNPKLVRTNLIPPLLLLLSFPSPSRSFYF